MAASAAPNSVNTVLIKTFPMRNEPPYYGGL